VFLFKKGREGKKWKDNFGLPKLVNLKAYCYCGDLTYILELFLMNLTF
jgi:hypothetical protein